MLNLFFCWFVRSGKLVSVVLYEERGRRPLEFVKGDKGRKFTALRDLLYLG